MILIFRSPNMYQVLLVRVITIYVTYAGYVNMSVCQSQLHWQMHLLVADWIIAIPFFQDLLVGSVRGFKASKIHFAELWLGFHVERM